MSSASNEPKDAVSATMTLNLGSATANPPRLGGTFKHDASEITCAPVGLLDPHFVPPYSPC